MEKFKVHVYYTYAAYVEVLAIADKIPTKLLEYVGHSAGDVVIDSEGECYEM